MIKLRGYELSISYGLDKEDERYKHHVTLWTQPLHRWLIAWAYHRYDMIVFRLPGFKKLERFLEDRENAKLSGDEFATPLSAKQDLRCFDLSRRDRDAVITFDIDQETYRRLMNREHDPVAQG